MQPHDDYKQLAVPDGMTLVDCPVCGAKAELWQYSTSNTSPTSKAGMCQNKDVIGPQDGVGNEGCLLYMPPDGFYRPTMREAVNYWNEFAVALGSVRRKNHWVTHKALRQDQEV